MGVRESERQRGAVSFSGDWRDCWRANWRLRTANRVLVELASWDAKDGPGIAAGARALISSRPGPRLWRGGLDAAALFHPDRTFAIQATSTASEVRDTRWAAMSLKDGLVDGQRDRWGRRSDVDRQDPDLHLRLRLHRDRATLLLDTYGRAARPPRLPRRHRRRAGARAARRRLRARLGVGRPGAGGRSDVRLGDAADRGRLVRPRLGARPPAPPLGLRAPAGLRRGGLHRRAPGADPRHRPRRPRCTATTSPPRRSTPRGPTWSRRTSSTAPPSPAATPPPSSRRPAPAWW